ncbi:uncharacterized protein E0L32_011711 [Thyridium curvatum]|uniref:CID domain-containing protein n=1 Tax=Thyridium curvatum TaxID=1093900 RepID=A0A507BNL4_9PEZI|nr:uncharacterized protein E0L32_011711 [Thyridium curvatum]TPX18378.1 hypothetical protein E0L32_011711 [Thyridium curvatum]
MVDPFEVRVRFSSQLQNLNASVTSAQKAAAYAMKRQPQTPVNTRANIMYFIEHFLEHASKNGHANYVRMLQRDIIRVVDAVAPEDGSGAANVKVVRKVLHGLQKKDFLESQAVTEIEEVLKEREAAHDISLSSPPSGEGDMGDMPPSQTIPKAGRSRVSAQKLDKKQIEQRIEEDRERHKRLRENIWAVPRGSDAEMWKLWDETSDLGEDDHIMGQEELIERERCLRMSCSHRETDHAANGRQSH